ncbi:MAG TPA: protease pro-enzyme activation domain-containing protein, partial [Acidimicrobiales bacterium]
MVNLRTKAAVAATLVAAAAFAGPAAQGTAAVRSPAVIAPAHVLATSQYHALRATNLVIGLDFYVPPRSPADLAHFIASVSTPGSATYHRYLARGQFASRFGATAATISSVSSYLSSHGLSSVSGSADHL